MITNDIWVVYSTFPNQEEALSVARKLVEERLLACVNLFENVLSVYRWQGNIQQEKETVLMAKTSAGKVAAAIARIKKLHSYELPCITAYPVAQGFPPFLQWVAEETST